MLSLVRGALLPLCCLPYCLSPRQFAISLEKPNELCPISPAATATAAATATLSPAVASASLERKTHGPIVKTSGKSTCELVGLDHYHPASGGSGDVAIGGGGGGVGISLSGGENQIDCSNCHGFTHSSAITSVNKRIEMAPVSSSLISHKEIPRRQKEAIVSTCALTLITCHLFNKGFKGEFIDSIIIRLREDQKVTGISPRQVFTWNNQQILQVNSPSATVTLFISLL